MSKERVHVVSAAIVAEGRYLITQRTARSMLPLLWEFPGGKVEPGETDAVALRREIRHRLGVEVIVGEHLATTEREYKTYIVELKLFSAALHGDKQPQALHVADMRWVASADFGDYAFTPADQISMDALLFGRTDS